MRLALSQPLVDKTKKRKKTKMKTNLKKIRKTVAMKIGTNDFEIRVVEKSFAPGCTHTVWVSVKGSRELTEVRIQ